MICFLQSQQTHIDCCRFDIGCFKFSVNKEKRQLSVRSSESVDLWFLDGVPAVQQHVGVRWRHQAVLDLPDHGVIEAEPHPGRGVVAHGCVVTHIQVTYVVLQKTIPKSTKASSPVSAKLKNLKLQTFIYLFIFYYSSPSLPCGSFFANSLYHVFSK